jgi:hypothetical protein
MFERDTSREAHAAQLRVYARMGPERRVQLAFELSEAVREISIAGVQARNPGWSRQAARAAPDPGSRTVRCGLAPSPVRRVVIVGILEIRGDEPDRSYIERWVPELGVAELWRRACAEVELR